MSNNPSSNDLPDQHNKTVRRSGVRMVYIYMMFAAMAGSAVYIGQKLSPKMLIYRLQIRPFPPSIVRSSRTRKLHLAVSANVELYNENLIHLDVHALSFDFYVRNHQDQLRHLGSVFDTFPGGSATAADQQLPHRPYDNSTTTTSSSSSSSSSSSTTTALVSWSLPALSHFTTRTKLAVALRPWRTIQSTWRLVRQLIRYGHLELKTTGVAHVRAAAAQNYTSVPLTITISCDNRVDLKLNGVVDVLGRDCAMQQMAPGWLDLTETAAQLRRTMMAKTTALVVAA
jgi:hypothetical protein